MAIVTIGTIVGIVAIVAIVDIGTIVTIEPIVTIKLALLPGRKGGPRLGERMTTPRRKEDHA